MRPVLSEGFLVFRLILRSMAKGERDAGDAAPEGAGVLSRQIAFERECLLKACPDAWGEVRLPVRSAVMGSKQCAGH